MAYQFAGSSTADRVDCVFSSATNPNLAAMTVGAWVKPDILPAYNQPVFVHGAAAGGAGYGLQVGFTSGQILLTKFGVVDIFAGLTVTVGEWRYIAAVVTATNVRFVMVTPTGVTSAVDVADSNAFAGSPNATTMGVYDPGGSYYDGAIAEVAVWIGDALSDAAITTAALNKPSAAATDGFWWMYDNLLDTSGNAQHGTLGGSVTVTGHPLERTQSFYASRRRTVQATR